MSDVMLAVPGVEREHAIERLKPAFRMLDRPREIGVPHRAKHGDPPGVEMLEQIE